MGVYRLRALAEVRRHPRPYRPGEMIETDLLGFCVALVRQRLAEPLDEATARDCELGIRLQNLLAPRPPKIHF